MKLNATDTAWLLQGATDATVTEEALAERLGLRHVVRPVRDGDDVILTLADGTCVVLRFQGEDIQDGETTAWNFADEDNSGCRGDYYLKVEKD